MTIYLAVINLNEWDTKIIPFEKEENAVNYVKATIIDYIIDCVNDNDIDAAIRYVQQADINNLNDDNIPFYISIGKDEYYVEIAELR